MKLLLALSAVLLSAAGASDLARGWGDKIAWRTLAEGTVEAAASGKPLMAVVWKTWCVWWKLQQAALLLLG